MHFIPQAIPDVIEVVPQVFKDDRGFFLETYHQDKYKAGGISVQFVQDNQSYSQQHTLRGLHFQKPPFAQAKLVSVIVGEIFDVAVDIRPDSPTYGKWVGVTLTDSKHNQLYIPEGFAHGFYVLSKEAIVTYKCSNIYAPQHEGSIIWNDPDIGINWPLLNQEPMLSKKDVLAPAFKP